MLEIRFHGRAQQGAKSAAQLIAEVALEEGKEMHTFPEYGPERGGAPVKAYVRIDDKKIRTHQPIEKPDVAIVIDPFFIDQFDISEGLKASGILIINSSYDAKEIRNKCKFKGKIFCIDATQIALEAISMDKPNTPILGAFVKVTGAISLDILKKQIKEMFQHKGNDMVKMNFAAVQRGYDEVKEC